MVGGDNQDVRVRDHVGDAGEVLIGEGDAGGGVQVASDLSGVVGEAQSIAVALGLSYLGPAGPGVAALHVVDGDGDAQILLQVLGGQTGGQIHAAACLKGADDVDALLGPVDGLGGAGGARLLGAVVGGSVAIVAAVGLLAVVAAGGQHGQSHAGTEGDSQNSLHFHYAYLHKCIVDRFLITRRDRRPHLRYKLSGDYTSSADSPTSPNLAWYFLAITLEMTGANRASTMRTMMPTLMGRLSM